MEQVPKKIPYGIVGSGRAANHFARYLELKNIPFVRWSRKLNQTPAHSTLQDAKTVLVLIQDSAIVPFLEAYRGSREQQRVHFSGALQTSMATGFHPLTSFGPHLHSLEHYEKIPFVGTKEGVSFESLFPEFKNPAFYISETQKPLYHALCVLGGNFSTLLWSKLFDGFEKLGLDPKIAFPYFDTCLQNTKRLGSLALTGPLARKDFETIKKNLAALEGDPFREIYTAFVEAFLENELSFTEMESSCPS